MLKDLLKLLWNDSSAFSYDFQLFEKSFVSFFFISWTDFLLSSLMFGNRFSFWEKKVLCIPSFESFVLLRISNPRCREDRF